MYFIDVQGTLIDDAAQRPVTGATAFIECLNREAIPYVVVTNNTKCDSDAFLAYLNAIGFAIPPERYLDALMMLENKVSKECVAAYGSDVFLARLTSLGYRLDYTSPKTVLLSVRPDYDAPMLAQMIGFLTAGAGLVGMHDTTLYVHEGKRYPGVGALLRLLAYAADVPFSVVGKPSRDFYEAALQRLRDQAPEAEFREVTMISDDYAGDLVGAAALGMQTALVLSGKVRPEDRLVERLRREESGGVVYNDVSKIM